MSGDPPKAIQQTANQPRNTRSTRKLLTADYADERGFFCREKAQKAQKFNPLISRMNANYTALKAQRKLAQGWSGATTLGKTPPNIFQAPEGRQKIQPRNTQITRTVGRVSSRAVTLTTDGHGLNRSARREQRNLFQPSLSPFPPVKTGQTLAFQIPAFGAHSPRSEKQNDQNQNLTKIISRSF